MHKVLSTLRKALFPAAFVLVLILNILIPTLPVYADSIDLYWVGGSGSWSDTAHWSDSSGGAGGHAVPTSTNNVFFDGNSFTVAGQTVAVATAQYSQNVDFTGAGFWTPKLTNSSGSTATNWYVYGSWTWDNGVTFDGTSTSEWRTNDAIVFKAAGTWTAAGGNLVATVDNNPGPGWYLDAGAGNTVTMGDSFRISLYSWTSGTLAINPYTLTIGYYFSGGGQTYDGTVVMDCSNPGVTISPIVGANVFNNLTLTQNDKNDSVTFASNNTVNGTLTMQGTSRTNRLGVVSTSTAQRTITAATVVAQYVDFYYIVGAGAGDWDLSSGAEDTIDFRGNSGITFTYPDSSSRNYYWYGGYLGTGSGTWTWTVNDWSSSYNWGTVSGGATGAARLPPPGSGNNVYFDANSGFNITNHTLSRGGSGDGNLYCKDMDFTGVPYPPFFSGPAGPTYINHNVSGSITWAAGMGTGEYSKGLTLNGTGTMTFNGVTIQGSMFNTVTVNTAGTITMGDDWSFNQVNFNWAAGTLVHNNNTLTFDSTGDDGSYTFTGGGKTWYNFTGTAAATGGNGKTTIAGSNTFNNFSYYSGAVQTGRLWLTAGTTQTVNGTLTFGGNSQVNKLRVESNTNFSTATLAAANNVVSNDVLYQDIIGSDAAKWDISANRNGNLGHNTNITFTVGADQFWVGDAGSWSDLANHWASTTGGAPGSGRIPLPQDTAIFDANSIVNPSLTVTIDMTDLSGIYTVNILNNPTFSKAGTVYVYDDFQLGTCVWSVTTTYFAGSWDTVISTMPGGMTTTMVVNKYGTNHVQAANDYVLNGYMRHLSGEIDMNGLNVTAQYYDNRTLGTTYSRTLLLGSGTFTLNGTAAVTKWDVQNTNYTLSALDSTILLTNSTTNTQTFAGASLTYGNVTQAGTGNYQLTISGSNLFIDLAVDRSQASKTLALTAGTTTTVSHFYFTVWGTTTGVLKSTSTTNANLVKTSGIVWTDYLTINDNTASGGASFYAGTNSTLSDSPGWNLADPTFPDVTTITPASDITDVSATISGSLDTLGDFDLGYIFFKWGDDPTLTIYDTTTELLHTSVDLPHIQNEPLAGLVPLTPYYYQMVVRYNVSSYAYGTIETFTTVAPDLLSVLWFEPNYMISSTTMPDRAISDGTQNGAITFGTNGAGISITFVSGELTVSTNPASNIQQTSATLNGLLSDLGSYTNASVFFQYGLTAPAYGSATAYVTKTTTGAFDANITGLLPNTTYHFRAVAVGTDITVYGLDQTFTTTGTGTPGTNSPDILEIVDAKVVSGYMTAGDQMYLVSYKAIYLAGTPAQPASEYFVIQILNQGAVVGQWSLPDWGYNPVGLYLGTTSALPYGGTYTIKIVGIPAKWPVLPTPAQRVLNPSDWLGTDLTQFDNWVLQTAKSIGDFYDIDLLTYTASGTVLNATGCALFNRNISGMSQVRPQLCSVYATRPSPTPGPGGTSYTDQWNAATNLGPYINGLLQEGATTMSMDQVAFNNLIGVIIWCVIVVILLFALKGSFMAALLAAPVLMGISWAGLLIPTIIVVLAVINVALLAYALLPRGTG